MIQKPEIASGTTEPVRQTIAPQWRVEDFRAIVTRNADAMVVLDRNGHVLYVNPAAESLFNMSADEMKGVMFGFPIVPDEPVEMYVLREFEQFIAVEMRLAEVVWSGQAAYLISFRDLTDRIIAEQALRSSRDRLQTVVHDQDSALKALGHSLQESEKFMAKAQSIAHLGFWVWDIEKDSLRISSEACEILGLKPDEIILGYKEFLLFVHPEDRQMVDSITRDVLEGKRHYNVEWRLLLADGTVRYIYSQGEVDRENGKPVRMMGTLLDITQRRQMEKELSEAKAQAELYLDLLGHDINNINQSAMGFLELALETLQMDKKIRLDDKILIEKPLKALHNSATLIDNVRKLQRLMKEGVKVRPVDLMEILTEMDASSFQSNGRNIAINIQPLPRCIVRADELLKDVIFNLINNAVKHSDEEKPLTVNVSVMPAEVDGRPYYKCIVEDNGPGIPDDLKDKLFTRFQRGATKAHGKGLGLYLVRTLVESYHGKVWAEDRVPGDHTQGARFVVMLPSAG